MCIESCHAVARQVVGRHAGFESEGLIIQYAITVMDEHAAILRHQPPVNISKLTDLIHVLMRQLFSCKGLEHY